MFIVHTHMLRTALLSNNMPEGLFLVDGLDNYVVDEQDRYIEVFCPAPQSQQDQQNP